MHRTRALTTVVYLSIPHTPTRYTGYYTHSDAMLNVCLMYGMPVDYKPYAWSTLFEKSFYPVNSRRITLLMRYNADVNAGGGFPIRHAAWCNRLDIVEMLINAGADVNLQTNGNTAILSALMWASHTIVSRLLQAGAILPEGALALARDSKIDTLLKVECIEKLVCNSSKPAKPTRWKVYPFKIIF